MPKVAGGQYITRPGRPASTGRTLTAKQEREVQRLSKTTYSARSLRGRTFPRWLCASRRGDFKIAREFSAADLLLNVVVLLVGIDFRRLRRTCGPCECAL